MSATTRLPNPGGDSGNWGTVLNDFVSQSMVASTTASPDNGLLKPDHAAITKGGNVGMGTSAPNGKLHVVGTSVFQGSVGGGSVFNYGTNEDTYVRSGTGAGNVSINDNATATSTTFINPILGRVAIGYNATPPNKLFVVGDVGISGTETGTFFNFGANEDVFIRAGKSAGNVYIADHSGAKNTILNSSTGNVGIGNGNPTTKLAVNGEVSLAGASANSFNSHFNFGANEETYIRSGKAGGNVYIADYPGSGNVGIGGPPGTKFHAFGTSTFTGTSAGSQNSHFNYGTNEDAYIRSGTQQGVVRLQDTPGNVMIGNGNPTSKLHIIGLTSHLDNAAAIAAGLTQGAVYFHPSGELRIVV
jgi:hypothetical protein